MSHFVYIIESFSLDQWYYGYSSDLEIRLDGHNKGLNKSTRGKGPWKFIFIRNFDSRSEALNFERYLKKLKNKHYIRVKFNEYFL